MHVLVLGASVAVAVMFGVAGISKLRDVPGFGTSAAQLGVPRRAIPLVVFATPTIEVALALGLLVPATRRLSAVGAAVLLVVFAGLLGRAAAQGRDVRCACFGSLGSAEVGWGGVARDLVAAAAAVLVASRPTTWAAAASQAGGGRVLAIGGVAAALAVALVVVVRMQLALLARHGEVLLRLDAAGASSAPEPPPLTSIEVGAPVPDLVLATLDGGARRLSDLWSGAAATLLVFSSPGCSACRTLLDDLAEVAPREPGLRVAVISSVSARQSARELADAPLTWLVDRERAAFEAFGAARTPTALLVGPDGRLIHAAGGLVAIRTLLQRSDVAPSQWAARELYAPDGTAVTTTVALGAPGAALFWDPDCPHCQRIEPEVADLAARWPSDQPPIALVVARPPTDEVAGQFGWPVWFDPDGAVTRAAGSPGTPSLMHLAAGTVDGPPAIGADDVLHELGALAEAIDVDVDERPSIGASSGRPS